MRPAALVVSGCLLGCAATGAQQVARWEEEGDLPALKRALTAKDPALRQAAAGAIGRYAAYDTSRPAMLATLQRAGAPEAQAAARALIGRPPEASPDPAATGERRAPVVIYFYRPAGDGPAAAEWFAVDGREVARLQPGRHYRYETEVGLHRLACHLPPDEGEQQKDMHFVISTPMAGVYFVRHRIGREGGKPSFDVMPVPPGLRAVRAGQAAAEADVAEAERVRVKELSP